MDYFGQVKAGKGWKCLMKPMVKRSSWLDKTSQLFSQLEIGGGLLLPGEGSLQYFEEQPVALQSIVLLRSIAIEQSVGRRRGRGRKDRSPLPASTYPALLWCTTLP